MTISPIGATPNTSLAVIPKNNGSLATIREALPPKATEAVKSNKKLVAIVIGICAGITAAGVAIKKFIDHKKANQEQKPVEETAKTEETK